MFESQSLTAGFHLLKKFGSSLFISVIYSTQGQSRHHPPPLNDSEVKGLEGEKEGKSFECVI